MWEAGGAWDLGEKDGPVVGGPELGPVYGDDEVVSVLDPDPSVGQSTQILLE